MTSLMAQAGSNSVSLRLHVYELNRNLRANIHQLCACFTGRTPPQMFIIWSLVLPRCMLADCLGDNPRCKSATDTEAFEREHYTLSSVCNTQFTRPRTFTFTFKAKKIVLKDISGRRINITGCEGKWTRAGLFSCLCLCCVIVRFYVTGVWLLLLLYDMYLYWPGFIVFTVVISYCCFWVLAKRLAGKNVHKMTYFVWSRTLNLNQLCCQVNSGYLETTTRQRLNRWAMVRIGMGRWVFLLMEITRQIRCHKTTTLVSACSDLFRLEVKTQE